MKEQLKRLCDLQELDLERDALQETVEAQRNKLTEEETFLASLNGDLDKQREALEGTRALFSSKRTEHVETEARLGDAKNKFHNVSNSREYAAAEREVEGLKKILAQLEEETGQLNAAIQAAEESISEKEAKINELLNALTDEKTALEEASKSTLERAEELKNQQKKLAKSIRPDVLGRYRFIRSRRPGKAVVPAIEGACTGCFMQLPPQAYIQLQRGTTLESCQNCNRILYFRSEVEAAAETA